jgi:hypothetical protein
MIAFTESFTLAFRQKIGEFALANRLPMVAELREFAVLGGLASYGTSRAHLWAVVGELCRKDLARGQSRHQDGSLPSAASAQDVHSDSGWLASAGELR